MAITAANVLGRQIKQTVPYVDLNAVQQESLQEEQRTDKKNKGGVLGGVGYLGEKAAAGFMQSVEGIWDYSAGGIASLLGADAWAERQFKNDWFGDWYETAGEWYNPNKVMKVAGDVASGIGTSIPALGAAAGVTALAVATGGASVTPTILAIASGVTGGAVAGLGAAGTATKEAYRKTGELGGKEFGYGALVGLTEGTIEGVSDAIGMGTGAIVKSIAGGTARGIGKSAIKSTVKSASASLGKHAFLKTGAKAFLGEAFEEGVAEILSPYFARATYDPEAENATLQEVAYASFIGGLSGLVMGGAQGSVNMAQARISGGNIVASGNGQSVVDGARALLADAEKQGYFDSEAIKTLREVYDQYVATEKSGAEGTFTDKQKYLIGKMNVASTSVVLNEAIITSALHLVENADQVAAAFDTYNYTDENGNKVTFTADQIREGLDGKNKRGDIAQLLKKNSVLRALAAADAAGRLMADTQSVADAMLAGRQINEDVFADFVKNADERVKEETARELGIEDWNVVDAVATNIHIKDYMENRGGAEAYARRSLAASSFEQHRNTEGKEIPKSFRATKDGIYRYTSGSDNIAVKKDGDTYTIYDYDSKTLSKELTKEELNRALAKHARQAEKTTQSAEAVAEVSEQVTEVKSAQEQEKNTPKDSVVKRAEKLAQEKVVGYDKLNARNKKTVEKIIRQGIVRGVKEDVVIAYANVAARAKVDVVFDKKEFPVIGKNKEGKEVRANGLYEPHTETIYANPEAQSSDDILIHELDHAIRKTVGKDGAVTTKQYNDAILAVSDDVRQEIAKTYTEKRRISAIEKVEIANDEVEAYYAQTALGGKDIIRHLISQKPSLKQRILDFFKGAKEDYRSVPILDKQAAKYYKQYKKWFDEFAERRKYRNIEKGLAQFVDTVDVRYSFTSIAQSFFGKETMTVDEFLAGDYKTTEGYKKYVNECLSNMSQTRDNFNEANARKEIEASIDGIVRVAVAAKTAGYDIIDSAEARSKTDSKGRGLFTSLEPNSDYFTSHDISTICDKRKNFSDIHDDIVREEQRLGVPRGKGFFDNVSNYFVIHDILARKGMTAPCRECYVESMRKNLAPMAEAFLTLIEETNPENKQNKQLWSKGKQKVGNATLRDRVLEQMRSEGLPQNFFDKVMLTTEDGLAQLRIEHPLLYEAFNSFYGQSKPKMPKSSVPFRFGELTALLTDDKGKIKDSLVKKINSTGGFRLQSYSDFQIENFVDVLQVIFEAGTLGLSGHAYTKVPAFLTATEGTNLKRNMSVFMYQDGNEWRIDKNDSFPGTMDDLYQRVKADKSGNTGIIVVSQNDSNSAWIMANDYIGYGIPFHKSGIRMGVVRETIVREDGREIKGYSNVKDHTKFQSETWAKITADHKAGTKVKNGINIYDFWDFDNAEKLSRNDLIKKNVKRYINECEKLGYRPKFADYLKGGAILNETLAYAKKLGFAEQNATVDAISFKYKGYTIPYGYYKFLGDFSMFTFDGKSSPHEVLSLAKYDFDKAVSFFKDAENVRREEILQQFANGTERDRLRKSKMTTEELSKLLRKRRDEVVSEVVGRSKDVRASIDINNDIRYSIPLDAVDNYTEEQYNSFGWARVSEAITKNELDDVYSKLQEKKSLRRFKQSARGEAIIEVNDKPKTTLGVDNVFVFAKGSATEPEITRVLRVSLFSETDMEKVRKFIYDNEKRPNARTSVASRGIFFETGIFAEYARKDFGSYQEYRSEIRKRSSGSQSQRDQDAHRIEYERARYTRRSEDDVSYSIPLDTEIDSNYLDAVNRGDMETAQKMVDEAAKKMGYTKKAYHQTNADFTEFDLSKSREGVYGKGAYFSTEKSPKGTYGSKDMSLYMLDTRKFLDLPNDGEQLKQIFDRLGFPYDKTTLNNFIENAKNRNGFRLYEYLMHVFRFHVREDISPYATEHGYKGLFDANTGIYVVYDPNMVKSSDPVTYDDSGNVIPLSKRFDSKNNDIRYSIPFDTEGLTETDVKEANDVIRTLKTHAMAARLGVKATAMYTQERIDAAIKDSASRTEMDYAQSYITFLDPLDFISATTWSADEVNTLKQQAGTLDAEKLSAETQPIYLRVNFESGRIIGHEGRHRMLALNEAGIGKVPVIIYPYNYDRKHTKPIEFMPLKGQEFEDYKVGSNIYLHNALPLSKRYAEVASKIFTQTPQNGVRFSVPLDAEIDSNSIDTAEQHAVSALKEFGTTSDFYQAGFVTQSGRMLKLSQFGQRGVQHKIIERVFDDVKGADAVAQFIQEGNFRIKAESHGIEIGTETPLSVSQLNVVSRFVSNCMRSAGVFYLDITDRNGNDVASVTYTDRNSASFVIYDIKDYYERGRIPKDRDMDFDMSYSLPLTDSDGNPINYDEIISKGSPFGGTEKLTVGQMRKRIANGSQYKVYSKKNMLALVKNFAGSNLLSDKTNAEFADTIWQALNSAKSHAEVESFAHDMAEYILARTMKEGRVKKSGEQMDVANARLDMLRTYVGKIEFTQSDLDGIRAMVDEDGLKKIIGRWAYKGKRKGINTNARKVPMEVFVTDISRENAEFSGLEDMHPVDAFLELDAAYEAAKTEVNDKWESAYYDAPDEALQQIVSDIERDIMLAHEYLGEKSEYKKRIDDIIEKAGYKAQYWKAEHDKVHKASRMHNMIARQLQNLADLKNHKFANATQIENDTLDSVMAKLTGTIYKGNLSVKKVRSACAELLTLYQSKTFKENILEYYDETRQGYFNGMIETYLEVLSGQKKIEGVGKDYVNPNGKSLSFAEMKMLSDVVSYLTNFYKNYGKVWKQGKLVDALPIAEGYVKLYKGNENLPMGKINSALMQISGSRVVNFFEDPASVVRRHDLYEDGFVTEVYRQVREAAYMAEVEKMRTMEKYDEFLKKNKSYIGKASKDTVDFRGEKIAKIKLIGLYCTSKRQHAQAGLAINGFQFIDLKGKTVRVDGRLDANAKYTEEQILEEINALQQEIEKNLTAQDKEYIEIIEDIYNNKARSLKEQRDFERYGFSNVTGGYYYPISRADTATSLDTDMKAEIDRVSNASFNKDIVKGAKQELFIDSADALVRRHVSAVCSYAYFSPVIDFFDRIYNMDTAGNRNRPITVKSHLKNQWSGAEQYFRKLLEDAQGITKPSDGSSVFSFFRGGYAVSALAFNPKVLGSQLSSFIASTSILDADCVAKGVSVNAKEVDKYCPLAELRVYDNTAAMAQAVVDTRGKAKGAGTKVLNAPQKIGQLLMTPIGWVDRAVIVRLFGACQVQIEKNSGGKLKVGTEQNKIKAGELLKTVILETQQNTLATEKSAAMRSNNEIFKAATMFSADAMKVLGRVIDSYGEIIVLRARINATQDVNVKKQLQERLKVANRNARKATAAILVSAAYLTALSALFRHIYDKDDDKDAAEYAKSYTVEFFGNVIGGMPIVRDVYSLVMEGYDIDHYAYSAVNDLVKSGVGLVNSVATIAKGDGTKQDVMRSVKSVVMSVSQTTGLPTRNVYNMFYGLTKRFTPENAYKIDSVFYKQNYASDLTKALEDGDVDMANMIYSLLCNERIGTTVGSDALNEMHRLAQDGKKVLPRSVAKSVTIDGAEYALSVDEQSAIQQQYKNSSVALDRLVESRWYLNMNDEERQYALDYIFDVCYKSSVSNVIGIDRGNAAILANSISAEKLAILATKMRGITEKGDARRNKVLSLIRTMNASKEEKLVLLCLQGYSIKDGDVPGVTAKAAKTMLLKYITTMSASAWQKAEIAKMCGFNVENGKIITKEK